MQFVLHTLYNSGFMLGQFLGSESSGGAPQVVTLEIAVLIASEPSKGIIAGIDWASELAISGGGQFTSTVIWTRTAEMLLA
ncbi:hypothetical protein VMCG_04167 [Cytospora schulzeri]|uniref:Uncharacterized protein n=1 Tax=Cytospora schulzeri TaxID=448051 RepID=A0A423WUH3_9PEZI|nr:hypothetical protein VMCG_04167 [Valsa malicola]